MRGRKFGDGEGDSGEELAVGVDGVLLDARTEERRVGGKGAGMVAFVAVRGEEVSAIGRAVDRDFALGAATDGADFFGFGRAKASGFAFLADGTGHKDSFCRSPFSCLVISGLTAHPPRPKAPASEGGRYQG